MKTNGKTDSLVKSILNAFSMVTIPTGVAVGITSVEGAVLTVLGIAVQFAKYYVSK